MRFGALVAGGLGALSCRGCGRPQTLLCSRCSALVVAAAPEHPPPAVDRVIAPWAYVGAARALILDLKLRGQRLCALPLARGIYYAALADACRGSILTWVPGRRVDIRRRGFDHAELIAREVARLLGTRSIQLLHRSGKTLDQTSLGASARRENLRGAFVGETVRGEVLLVDDLVTTGATAASCARALGSRGATRIEVLAACRRSRPNPSHGMAAR